MRILWFPSVLCLVLPAGVSAGDPEQSGTSRDRDVSALAARIDQGIAASWGPEVQPAPRADDAEFFRRACLDLIGRTPSITEIKDFLDDKRPDKRRLWVEVLLKKEGYAEHFANVWRAWLLTPTNQQAQFGQFALEAWLKRRLRNNLAYDQLIRELLLSPDGNQPFGQPGIESPVAFYQANENRAENLAGSTARLFLGIRVECAQCHNHPFDRWTRTQFWEYAAFFAPNEAREIAIPGGGQTARARFLDGTPPSWEKGARKRTVLADWMTAPGNPYFARAAVNRLWDYFFGLPLVEEWDGEEEQEAGRRALLEGMARDFVAHGYDLKFLIRGITASQTYQRASALSHPSQKDPRQFARKALRALTPEQLFDSLAAATEYRDNTLDYPPLAFGGLPRSPRAQFLAKFAGPERTGDPQTSILQALYLMNSSFIADRTNPAKNRTLDTIARQRTSTARKVETLYLVVLSRKPVPAESERFVQYVEGGAAANDSARALADVFWVLLNSPEFILNH
jgi:hypothetical protein